VDIYNYDDLGVFISRGPAREDPLETIKAGYPVYALPAKATTIAPPIPPTGQVAVFNPATQTWGVNVDYRGQMSFSTVDGSKLPISALGPVPAGYTLIPRPAPWYTWDPTILNWELNLTAYRALACSNVDTQAANLRAAVFTSDPGQAKAYQLKYDQAVLCLADASASNASYPYIAAEVGITAPSTGVPATDLHNVATIIKAKGDAEEAWGMSLEPLRLTAKNSINAATSASAVEGVMTNLTWPAAPTSVS
jgi:hypothetical protein